jgi:hypothetical protein
VAGGERGAHSPLPRNSPARHQTSPVEENERGGPQSRLAETALSATGLVRWGRAREGLRALSYKRTPIRPESK